MPEAKRPTTTQEWEDKPTFPMASELGYENAALEVFIDPEHDELIFVDDGNADAFVRVGPNSHVAVESER